MRGPGVLGISTLLPSLTHPYSATLPSYLP